MKLDFFQQIFEKCSILSFMKIRPVGAELYPADGRMNGCTDRQTDRRTDVTNV